MRPVGAETGRAVVAGEDDERLLAQAELVEFGDELADLLVEVGDVVLVVVRLAVALAVGRAQDRAVDEMRRVVEVERLVAVPLDEVHGELQADVGAVNVLLRFDQLAVLGVALLPIPAAGGRIGDAIRRSPSRPACRPSAAICRPCRWRSRPA